MWVNLYVLPSDGLSACSYDPICCIKISDFYLSSGYRIGLKKVNQKDVYCAKCLRKSNLTPSWKALAVSQFHITGSEYVVFSYWSENNDMVNTRLAKIISDI